jgi:hypothetical protein
MIQKEHIYTFFRHSILSGLLIGISALMIELNSYGLAAFIYSSFPLGFIYLFWITKDEKRWYFSKMATVGAIFFTIFTAIAWYLSYITTLTAIEIIVLCSIIFIGSIYMVRNWISSMLLD